MENKEEKPSKLMPVFIILGSLVPFLFILSLPLLETIGYANSGDYVNDKVTMKTISNYISSGAATGGFGASFFFTIVFMWEAPLHKS